MKMMSFRFAAMVAAFLVTVPKASQSFVITPKSSKIATFSQRKAVRVSTTTSSSTVMHETAGGATNSSPTRRDFFKELTATSIAAATFASPLLLAPNSASAGEDISSLLTQIKEARAQLTEVPALIKAEQWDAVRALLLKKPINECWNKRQPLLQKFADAVGDDPKGDELAALEAKEDAASHMRYLDMAVYNNIFNPIKTEGESGASKELIRSYKEDPINEYKASLAALDALIELGNVGK